MVTRGTAPNFTSLTTVWWSIFASNAVFVVVLQVAEHPTVMEQPMLLPMLAVVAASTCAVAAILPSRIFAQGLKAQRIETREVQDPEQPPGFGQTIKVPSQPAQAARTALGLYMTKTILGCALGESVSLFGMVLGFLGAALPMCIPFFIAGALVQAYHYPRRSSMLNEAGGVLAIRFANPEAPSSQQGS